MACQDGAHTSHTTIANFKGIFIKYLIEFMTFWEMPLNLSQELLSNIVFYVVRIWQIKPDYFSLLSFLPYHVYLLLLKHIQVFREIHSFSTSLYMRIDSLNICSLENVSEILLLTDFANCCRTVGGWFEFLFMYTGLSFGFRYGL